MQSSRATASERSRTLALTICRRRRSNRPTCIGAQRSAAGPANRLRPTGAGVVMSASAEARTSDGFVDDMARSKTIIYLRDHETAFLNVDVGVFAKVDLEPLASALGDRVSLHYVGRIGRGLFQLHFALYSPKSAEAALRGIVRVIQSPPRSPRRLWNNDARRVFDIGFQGGFQPHTSEFEISQESVAAVAELGGRLKVTLYVAPAVEAVTRRGRRR
jgi:hypothetical protein